MDSDHPRGLPPVQALNAIERYDGSQDPSVWLDSLQEVADLYNWSDTTSLKIAKIKLSGPARSWARCHQFTGWSDFQKQLESRYGESKASAISRLERCWQRPNESVKDFADRYLQDAEKAGRVEDDTLVYNFTQRLLPELKIEVARQRLDTVEAIVDFCKFWADMNAPLDENRAVPYIPAAPLSPGAAPRFPRNFTGPPPKRPDLRNPPPYRPPFRDNTNRPTQPRPDSRPQNRPNNPPAAPPAPAAATESAVDELTKKFQRLELNVHHQMADKDREIRTLRFALKRQHEQEGTAQLNYLSHSEGEEPTEAEDIDLELLASLNYMSRDWEEVDEEDLDQELLASLMVKRPADDEPQYKRTPTKRTAFGPPGSSPHNTADTPANPAQEKLDASRRVPLKRQAFNAAPYPAGSSRPGPTAAPAGRPVPPAASRYPDAGQLVSDKARKMAADICRSIKFDGLQEATLPPQAVLTCLAGHLAADQALIGLGQDMARRVAAVLHSMRRGPAPAAVLNLAATQRAPAGLAKPAAASRRSAHQLYSRHPVPVLPKISTCKVMARINGREVDCVIDTGASTSAITLDCLRRLNLDSLIDTTKTTYLNADGRITAGKGKVPNLVLSLGEFETIINPTVTSALNYNVLIGNDVLTRARAVIDYNQGKMVIQVDPTFNQELDINMMNPEEFYHAAAPLQAADNTEGEPLDCPETALVMTAMDADPPTVGTLPLDTDGMSEDSDMSDDDSEAASECDSELISPASFYELMQYAGDPYADMDPEVSRWLINFDGMAAGEGLVSCPSTPAPSPEPADQLLVTMSHNSPACDPCPPAADLTAPALTLAQQIALQDFILQTLKEERERLHKRMIDIMAADRNDPAELDHQLKLRLEVLTLLTALQGQIQDAEELWWALIDADAETYHTSEDELLFFTEVPEADSNSPHTAPYTPEPTDTDSEADSDLSDIPGLVTDSELEASEDEDPYYPLPKPHRKAPDCSWASAACLPEFAVHAECPAADITQQAGSGESFPDDDALADHRDLSLASMIDRTNLTEEQFNEALQLLEDNRDVFCFHPSELGTCKIGAHTIDTGDAAPIKKPYYHMPYKKYDQLKVHVDRLLEHNVIRPSNSPWAAPMHLVPKKGNDTREVVDYRALNAVTKGDAFPIPRIDEILYNIGPANMWSVLDCHSGYLQCKMDGAPDDPADTHITSPSIERTAFSVPWGHYEYLRMPFGLQGGPATFMRIQQEVLKGLVGKKVFVFFDDTITYSIGFDKHKEYLIEIFGRLRDANLKLNPAKCQFFKDHVTFLGFVVDEKGLSPDPRLIEAISNRKEPHNAKAVASFLGLTGYYRRFVKDYSKIAEPLTRLLSPKVKFTWGPEQQDAFQTLKDKLTCYPILRRPDFSKPFILHTDASGHTIGAILAQKDEDGKEHAVAYHSKKLTPAERNWPITHLECFAVVNAVCDHFADFLLGHPFTVYTDCSALQWLLKSQKLQGKLARWSLRLQEFMPFDIQYRKGSQHQAADAMTRHADYYLTEDTPQGASNLLLTLQETPAAPLATPAVARLPAEVLETPASPGSAQSRQPATPNSLDQAMRSAVRICIEGNIGCGKSSVVATLQEHQAKTPDWQRYTIIPEPVQEWHHLLGPLYGAPPHSHIRHSTATLLQLAVLNAYALQVPSPLVAPTVITERSSWSSLAVFLPAQDLPPSYRNVVLQTAHHMYPNLDNAIPTAIIYLKADPVTCLDRVAQRQRPGENMLTLDYITKLHEQYERELATFPGPVITIDATKPPAAVAAAVKNAVDLLMGAADLTPSQATLSTARRLATAPYHVQDFPSLSKLFPDRALTTCDPYLLHMFPDQLLTNEEVAPAEADARPDTPLPTPAAGESAVPYRPYSFEVTPTELLYDRDYEVLVLFQNGPGHFSFSPQFCAEYTRRYGTQVNPQHRINNTQALELYAHMGPWLANGPGANIQIAAVPKKAADAIQVLQINTDGTEVVFVDTDKYAEDKSSAIHNGANSYYRDCLEDDGFPLEEAFRNEAYTLDAWVRLVRLRPMMPCGITLTNPRLPTLLHSDTPPSDCEYSPPAVEGKLRLAGGLPHQSEGLHIRTSTLHQINMLDDAPLKPKRSSAQKALQQIHTWTRAQTQAVTDSHNVPSDLPCELCGSPNDWKHMLLCSKCDRGFHTYCMGMTQVPDTDEWFCHDCQTHKRAKPNPPPEGSPSLPYFPGPSARSPCSSPFAAVAHEPASNPSSPARRDSSYEPSELPDAAQDLADHMPDLWQTAAEEEEAEDNATESATPALREIWEDTATLEYLKHNEINVELLPDDQTEMTRAIKRINKRAAAFYWNPTTGTLHKRATPRYPGDREVPPPGQRDKLIDDMHIELGHVGINKLCSAILARYYWMGVFADVKARLQQCQNCLRTKTLFKQQPELRPLPPSKIWDRVAMDSMGPYPPTKRNNRFILVAVDACSKWVEARAVPELTSAAMANFFKEEVACRHGTPTLCCTDNGKEFQKDFKTMLKSLGVAHNYSSAYHPESNGQAEAAVKATLHGLQKAVGANPFTWDDMLPSVLLGIRSTRHASTGFSPYFVLTGRHPVLPVDRRRSTQGPQPSAEEANMTPETPAFPAVNPAAAAAAGAPTELDCGTIDHLQQRGAQQQHVNDKLAANVKRAQEKQKKDFLKRHHSCPDPADTMPAGSFVLLKGPSTSKMHRCKAVEGPYLLVQYIDGNTRAILQEADGKTWPVATSRLAPYQQQ